MAVSNATLKEAVDVLKKTGVRIT
ncbi:transcriptional repressor, partial [Listeria monocytogenes]|nr:transcriptional repressor [Listeria monocytogenes]EGX9951769.1 transcriptional repressor [Listeria monocytogenes]EHT3433785.1 transcriptional repressor [Listeria monocytogenes]